VTDKVRVYTVDGVHGGTTAVVFTDFPSGIDHGGLGGLGDNDHPQYLLVADIDDTPVNGELAQPISSNWAFDHAALTTGVHGLAITAGQTLTVTTGGTLGSAAYTATTAYEASGAVATHAALTATHGVSGAIVGTTDTQELSSKTLNASVGKGTWTASGTWVLPAVTLGGTVSGGGNQINNAVIGTVTPLAGTFTTVKATTGIACGSATPGTSGIAFPATAVAVADVNTLDDYEEGTWTPTDESGASLSLTVVADGCRYVKIGKMVFLTVDILFPSTASGATITIGSMPFTCVNTTNNVAVNLITQNASGSVLVSLVNNNTTNFSVGLATNGTLQVNSLFSGALMRGTLIYEATA